MVLRNHSYKNNFAAFLPLDKSAMEVNARPTSPCDDQLN